MPIACEQCIGLGRAVAARRIVVGKGGGGCAAHASSMGVIIPHCASTPSRRVNKVASPRMASSSNVS